MHVILLTFFSSGFGLEGEVFEKLGLADFVVLALFLDDAVVEEVDVV